MGPRSVDRGIASEERKAGLPAVLQWGRDQLIAELRALASIDTATLELQWGRDQLIAELTGNPPSGELKSGFNGAAIS